MEKAYCEQWCPPKTPVIVYCQQCKSSYCKECDQKMHQGRRQKHCRQNLSSSKVPHSRRACAGDTKASCSHLLLDANEELLFLGVEDLSAALGCGQQVKLKVVSVFGNTGDGKSHTLNHTFFGGKEVFRTSPDQQSCTVGVWAAYSSEYNAIFLDSEGLLGSSSQEDRRTRLLLKVMAVSDIVVYRTRAERLHNDMFTFLGDASEAYWKYFTPELKNASDRYKLDIPLSTLGPSVVIFHETQYTELLGEGATQYQKCKNSQVSEGINTTDKNVHGYINDKEETTSPMTAEELLRIRFSEVGHIPKAFSSVEYVGTRTKNPPTNFKGLLESITALMKNNAVRAPRTLAVILKALQVLNLKFNGDITCERVSMFPDAYFSCPQSCLACGAPCELSMNHMSDGEHHSISSTRCTYNPIHDNKIFLCKTCYNRGIESIVYPKTYSDKETGWMGLAKYAWSGYVIECKHCGIIYRSRQHWYGNKEPELDAVRTENKHVWPEDIPGGKISDNTARRLLDGVGNWANSFRSASARPTIAVGGWLAEQVAPSYWVPNSDIHSCTSCKQEFTLSMTKHHCRACGKGFCDRCSSSSMPVPWRGWGNIPVRVCDPCFSRKKIQDKGEQKFAANKKEDLHTNSVQKLSKNSHHNGKIKSEKTEDLIWNTHIEDFEDVNQVIGNSDEIEVSQGTGVTARYMGEMVQSAMGLASGVLQYSKELVVESARPAYWEADADITHCHHCRAKFDTRDYRYHTKHHCRACGKGFCNACSSFQEMVPERGWNYPVRVCEACAKLLQQRR